jgi:chemotaxis protein MotA
MNIIIGLLLTLAVSSAASWPWAAISRADPALRAVIIGGAGFGGFLMANPMKVVKDTGKALIEAFKQAVPKERIISTRSACSTA